MKELFEEQLDSIISKLVTTNARFDAPESHTVVPSSDKTDKF
jgi:hypothetical protein